MIYLRMIRSMRGISVSLATRRRERSPPGKPARRGRILASRPSLPIDGGDSPPWLSFRRDGSGTACFPGRSHRKRGGEERSPPRKPGILAEAGNRVFRRRGLRPSLLLVAALSLPFGNRPYGSRGRILGAGVFLRRVSARPAEAAREFPQNSTNTNK